MIVEILSQGTQQRDRGYKKILYGRYGVREYWIVDAEQQTIEVYTLTARGFTLAWRYSAADVLTSAMLPGLRLALAEVFPGWSSAPYHSVISGKDCTGEGR